MRKRLSSIENMIFEQEHEDDILVIFYQLKSVINCEVDLGYRSEVKLLINVKAVGLIWSLEYSNRLLFGA